MLRFILITLGCIAAAFSSFAQQQTLKGRLIDTTGTPLGFASIALLNPKDSTMAYFGISNVEGNFEIKNVANGNYLMQSAYIGFKTSYRKIDIPLNDGSNDIGGIVMRAKNNNLKAVEIAGERIPILIKKDTIEYNAGAFKTKADASTEELLKKLPGIEVDRAGNIKAQGEDVKKVLVDGKEFFGNDPKIATKNLPADAIKKVQVFNKKSDQAEFTGIDDGNRDKTINLQLKDDKKRGYFGDLEGGYGTNNRYKTSAKLYNFKDKSQFAALGMLNNINQFGFSFNDYINFVGGMRSLMGSGGSMQLSLSSNSNLPINFGQPVTGLIASGTGGLNYTYEPRKNNRFNVSYLASGADKSLTEQVNSTNFTSTKPFNTRQNSISTNIDRAHRVFMNWKTGTDTTQKLIMNSNVSLNNSKSYGITNSRSLIGDSLINTLVNNSTENAAGYDATGKATYLKKNNSAWNLFKLEGNIYRKQSLDIATWQNITQFVAVPVTNTYNQFQHNGIVQTNYSANTSITRRLGNGFYLETEAAAGTENEILNRLQGTPPDKENNKIDSLSPTYTRKYQWIRPGISIKKNKQESSFTLWLRVEQSQLIGQLNKNSETISQFTYFVPSLSYSKEFGTSKRLALYAGSVVNSPTAAQLNPVVNNSNIFQLLKGNTGLRPEYTHSGNLNASWYDQFTFTSLFIGINGAYAKDKITFSRTISNNLVQELSYVNSPYNYNVGGSVHFSTPIRKVGANIKVQVDERYNKGISYINTIANTNTSISHELSVSFDNRKKEKWDGNIGGLINYNTAKYSVQQSMNNSYITLTYFTDLSYTPNDRWNFTSSADINNYIGQSFPNTVRIPLLKAEVSYYCLKAKRGVFSLQVFDILNKNTGLQRNSNLNMLTETQSNIIGRYVMLSFKYRLNKLAGDGGGVQFKVNR